MVLASFLPQPANGAEMKDPEPENGDLPYDTPQKKAGMIKADRTRKLIVEAAIRRFSQMHYNKVSVSLIVKDIGIAIGTFYLYFENKEDLFREVTVTVVARQAEAIDSHMAGIVDPIERLKTATRAILEFACQNPDLGRMLVRAAIDHPHLRVRFQEKLRADLELGAANGAFDVVVDGLLVNLVTVANAVALDTLLNHPDDTQLIDRHIEYLMRLLGVAEGPDRS
jgi:AcrR family transcriptional regulator